MGKGQENNKNSREENFLNIWDKRTFKAPVFSILFCPNIDTYAFYASTFRLKLLISA